MVVPRISDLPPDADVDRASWESLKTRSSLTVPIVTATEVSHIIAMATIADERDWPVELLPRLRVLGELMVVTVQKAQAVEALRSALDEVQRLRDRLERENVYLRKEVAHHAAATSSWAAAPPSGMR